MFDTKFSRQVAFYGAVVVVAAVSSFVSPFVASVVLLGLALYGGPALYEDVVKPWIDAGDDDDTTAA